MPTAPAFIRGSGNSLPRTPKRRLAWVVTVWASMVGWTPGSATEVRQPSAERIATGLVELLRDKRDVAYAALQAIAAKRGDTLDSDDRFWPDLTQRVLGREDVRAALREYVASRYPRDATHLDRLTQELPELADMIAGWLATSPRESAGRPVPAEVLRRMREPAPAAQRALLLAALDVRNQQRSELADRIVAAPQVTAGISTEILALSKASSDLARDLAFRYAVVKGAALEKPDIERALSRVQEPVVVRSALSWLAGKSPVEIAPYTTGLLGAAVPSTEPDIWARAVSLLAEVEPTRAAAAILDRAVRPEFRGGEAPIMLLVEAARHPPLLKLLSEGRNGIHVGEALNAGGCRVLPALLRLASAAPSATASGIVKAVAVTLAQTATQSGNQECDAAAIASSLDEAVGQGLSAGATSLDFLNAIELARPADARSVPVDAPQVATAAGILRRADRAREALAADGAHLKVLVTRSNAELAPGIAALVLSLPSDHPLLRDIRTGLFPPDDASLSDHVRRDGATVARILQLTARGSRWTDGELKRVVEIALQDASPDATRAAMEVLIRSSGPGPLLDLVDRTILASGGLETQPEQTLRAIRAMRRAVEITPEPAAIYTPNRLGWLLGRLPDERLRGRVVRVLAPLAAPSRDTAPVETALARAVAARGGSGASGACLDIATLGPFVEPGPALTLLGASLNQAFVGEEWSAPCLTWLAPSHDGALTRQGQFLVAMADERGIGRPGFDAKEWSKPLAELWASAEKRALGTTIRRRIAVSAAALAEKSAWDPAAVADLKDWDSRVAPDFAEQARAIRWEWIKRAAFLLAVAVPGAVALHLVFWGILLAAYPHSVRVQTHVFYNPLARKVLGLGYVDLLLVWIGPIRRRLFAPFRASLAGEVDRIAPVPAAAYYPRSGVTALARADLQREIREAERLALAGEASGATREILDALAGWKGPTCLFGPSGRGKTSYLRHALGTGTARRYPFVYLKASECRGDVVAAICTKLGGLGRDQDLVLSLVHSGLFDVYVDGLNEVEQDVQEAVVRFIVDHRSANVFVATQEVGLSLPSKLATFYLLPLSRPQMKEFLVSREPTLELSAPIRGATFEAKASAFIDELSAAAEASPPDGEAEEDPAARRRRELAASFLATLANPLDLETAARLLALDIEPDPFRLQQQQFRLVEEDYRTALGRPFPTKEFSRSVLEARRAGKAEVDVAAFGAVVAILELRKQVRPVTVRLPGIASTTEYRFRHERILDFYTHFALLGDDPAERFALVRERPFEGVFEYLARELPPDDAAELKEYLLSDALDRNDHRLSDRFLQHLRWRSLLDRQDPSWIVDFDLPAARDALEGFGALSVEREALEAEMRARRAIVDEARRVTRVLSAPDSGALETAVLAMFERMGGKVEHTEGGIAPAVVGPGDLRFALVCLAGEKIAGTLARIGVQARLERSTGLKLLVLNPQPDIDPRSRNWESLTVWDELIVPDLVVVTSKRLQDIFGRTEGTADKIPFWGELLGEETVKNHASTVEQPAA